MVQRRPILAILGAVVALLFLPGVAAAQETSGDGFVLQVNRTTVIGPDETVEGVVGIKGDVVVDGTVTGTLWVFDAAATVNGRVDGDVMIVNGTLDLGPDATVNNVALVRSKMTQAPGATITGTLSERAELFAFGWAGAIFSFLFWIGMTLVVVLAGLAFAAVGRTQLVGAGGILTGRPIESVVTALVLWVGLPVVAVLAFLSLIGIPLGLAVVVVVLPALWLLGYLVAGARLGEEMLRRLGQPDDGKRAYLGVVVGLLAFQIVGLVPFVGGLVVGLAGFVGSGALIFLAYRNRRGEQPQLSVAQEPAPTT